MFKDFLALSRLKELSTIHKNNKSSEQQYYSLLDGLRGIAILLVLTHHIRHAFKLDFLFQHYSPILQWIYYKAWEWFNCDLTQVFLKLQDAIHLTKGLMGMEMFFVLSGFLITRNLLRDNLDTVKVKIFYQRRFFRIYPTYALLVVVSFIAYSYYTQTSIETWGIQALRYFSLLQNYFPRNQFLEHTWSLVVMEQFYLVLPLIMLLVCRWCKTRDERRALLIGLCCLCCVLIPFVRILYLTSKEVLITWPWLSPYPHKTTLYHVDALAFGCLLALCLPYIVKLKNYVALNWVLWAVGIVGFLMISARDWNYFWGEWFWYTLWYVAVGCLVVAAINGVGVISRWKFLQGIGKCSYGTYLWHYLALILLAKYLIGKMSIVLLVILGIVVSLLLGYLSTRFIEKYFLAMRERISLS